MSRHFYSEIYLHLVWHTRGSEPLLTPEIEHFIHDTIRAKILSRHDGTILHEINGTENHIHLCVSMLPTTSISKLVGQIKGASSHAVNVEFHQGQPRFAWQHGYGVVSFGQRNLEWVTRYIKNQKTHHATNSLALRLERTMSEEPAGEPGPASHAG